MAKFFKFFSRSLFDVCERAEVFYKKNLTMTAEAWLLLVSENFWRRVFMSATRDQSHNTSDGGECLPWCVKNTPSPGFLTRFAADEFQS